LLIFIICNQCIFRMPVTLPCETLSALRKEPFKPK